MNATMSVGLALWLCAGAAVSADEAKRIEELRAKERESAEAARWEVNRVFGQRRAIGDDLPTGFGRFATAGGRAPRPVIYGDDDRIEYWQVDDAALRRVADAACVVTFDSEAVDQGDGTVRLSTSPWTSQGGSLCADEPFRGQPTVGFCSGFLVGSDIVVTAGHCVGSSGVAGASNATFVFGFQVSTEGGTAPSVVPAEYVYRGVAVIDDAEAGGFDHSVVRLDRPVTGISPIPVRREGLVANGTPLVVIGHPSTLPKKIAAGAEVKNNRGASTPWFQSNLDTYGGNSGSMVVNLDTLEIEGILVRGAPDFVNSGGCVRSNRVPDSGNTGSGLEFEEVSKTTGFAEFIPVLGLGVTPASATLHIGEVGGPFTNADVAYTLSNDTDAPIGYEISLGGPDNFLVLSGNAAGSVPAGGETTVVVSLDDAAAFAAAGVYAQEIVFADTTNARQTRFTHELEIGQTLVSFAGDGLFASGPVGGPFSGTATVTMTSERPTPTTVEVTADAPWVTLDGSAGAASFQLSGVGDTADVEIGIAADAATLGAGLYTATVTFTDLTSGATATRPVTVDIGRIVAASDDVPVDIRDNQTSFSTLDLGEAVCIADLEVDVDIAHTFIGDLIVELTSPEGTTVRLHNRSGSSSDNIVTRYGTGATTPSGPGSLADFAGELAAGVWTLSVADLAGGDQGQINAWSLRLAPAESACPPRADDLTIGLAPNFSALVPLDASVPSGNTPTFTIETLPTGGVLWTADGAGGFEAIVTAPASPIAGPVIYRANPGFTGADGFTYTATADGATSPTATVGITVGGQSTAAAFPLDTQPAGWTLGTGWGFGTPAGAGGDPSAGATGANVFGYNLSGAYENNITATRYLTSSAIDLSGRSGTALRFRRWLGMESSAFDQADVQVSPDNGATWTTLWQHDGPSFQETTWSTQQYDTASVLDGAAQARVRWGMGTTDGSVTFSGWNIDDIELLADEPAGNPADLAEPFGTADVFDILAFFDFFGAGDPLADFNADGLVDVFDVLDFFDFYAG